MNVRLTSKPRLHMRESKHPRNRAIPQDVHLEIRKIRPL